MTQLPLYRNDGVAILPLSDFQSQALGTVKSKIQSGEYRMVPNSCLCGNPRPQEDGVVSEKDRYGLPLKMLLCGKCGIVRAAEVLETGANMDFYTYHYRSIYVGSRIAPDSFFDEQVRRGSRLAQAFRNAVPAGTHVSSIFEIGCGAGGVLVPFKPFSDQCRGCDFDQNYLDYGKRHGLDLLYGDFEAVLPSDSAGAIILSHVLEHFLDPIGTLNAVLRKIAPGGYLIVEVPGILNIHKVYFDPILYFQNAHVYNFYADYLHELFGQMGLEVLHGDELAIFIVKKPVDWKERVLETFFAPVLAPYPRKIRKYLERAFFRHKYQLNRFEWYSKILGWTRHSGLNQMRRKWMGLPLSR